MLEATSKSVKLSDLPCNLGDGLILRWGEPEDLAELVEFNSKMHSETSEPEKEVGYWTADLMRGDHPTVKASDFTVVVDQNKGGKIVSSLNLISQTWAYAGLPFGVGRPEAVATDPAYRRKGLVRRQMEVIHARSLQRGELLQAITGIPWYYRQFGYEMTVNLSGARRLYFHNVPKLVAEQSEAYQLRPATALDIPVLQQLYELHCAHSLLSRVRNEVEWRYELSGQHPKSIVSRRFFLIEDLSGRAVAYLADQVANWPGYRAICELAVLPGQSLRAVAEFVSRVWLAEALAQNKEREGASLVAPPVSQDNLAPPVKENRPFSCISFAFGEYHPVYTALDLLLEKPIPPYAWYIRVPDLAAFVKHISPVLQKRLADSVMAGYTGKLRLNFYQHNLAVEFDEGRLTQVGTYEPATMREGDALFPDLTFLKLLLGHRSLDELRYAQADCYTINDQASVLLSILFPRQASDISPLG